MPLLSVSKFNSSCGSQVYKFLVTLGISSHNLFNKMNTVFILSTVSVQKFLFISRIAASC